VSEQESDMDLCRDVNRQCEDAGAEGGEVLITRTLSRTVTWQTAAVTGAVALVPRDTLKVVVRVFCSEGRVGLGTSTSSRPASIQQAVASAMAAAGEAETGPDAGPAPRLDVSTMGLGIYDRRNQQLTDEDRIDVVEQNVNGCDRVDGAHAQIFRYVETIEHRTFRSSRGVELSESTTHYSLKGTAFLVSDQTVQVTDEVASRHFADVASLPLGATLGKRVARYQGAIAVPEGELPVIIEPSVVAQLMLAVVPAFDRALIDAGRSFLSGQPDQHLGSPLLHLIDDAGRSGGLNTRGFDARGVPPVSLPLIREGKAAAFYTSVERAALLGARPCGHAHPRGQAWPGNLLLRSGNRSRNMMFPEIGAFLMLDGIVQGSLRVNLAKGRFSMDVHTFLADGVHVQGYLGVQRFRTSWIDLWGGIREIASDQRRFGCVDAATWVVDGLAPRD
jgi:predicted Zn-dependent protease